MNTLRWFWRWQRLWWGDQFHALNRMCAVEDLFRAYRRGR